MRYFLAIVLLSVSSNMQCMDEFHQKYFLNPMLLDGSDHLSYNCNDIFGNGYFGSSHLQNPHDASSQLTDPSFHYYAVDSDDELAESKFTMSDKNPDDEAIKPTLTTSDISSSSSLVIATPLTSIQPSAVIASSVQLFQAQQQYEAMQRILSASTPATKDTPVLPKLLSQQKSDVNNGSLFSAPSTTSLSAFTALSKRTLTVKNSPCPIKGCSDKIDRNRKDAMIKHMFKHFAHGYRPDGYSFTAPYHCSCGTDVRSKSAWYKLGHKCKSSCADGENAKLLQDNQAEKAAYSLLGIEAPRRCSMCHKVLSKTVKDPCPTCIEKDQKLHVQSQLLSLSQSSSSSLMSVAFPINPLPEQEIASSKDDSPSKSLESKNWYCTECGLESSVKSNAIAHVLTHFSGKGLVDHHNKYQNLELPYFCNQCGVFTGRKDKSGCGCEGPLISRRPEIAEFAETFLEKVFIKRKIAQPHAEAPISPLSSEESSHSQKKGIKRKAENKLTAEQDKKSKQTISYGKYKCLECGQSFKQPATSHALWHIEKNNINKKKLFICTMCPEEFQYRMQARKHTQNTDHKTKIRKDTLIKAQSLLVLSDSVE